MPIDKTLDKDKLQSFDAIALSIASPEKILALSSGEVTKPETINYRTQKPERDGLFCERIFGPTKNWECYCGKYKKMHFNGIICDKCKVQVTRSIVRRERMGHIKLAVPIAHIWFLRSTPSRIGLLLDLPIKTLEQVIYFAAYIIKKVNLDEQKNALISLEEEFKKQKNSVKIEFKQKFNEIHLKQRAEKTEKKIAQKEILELEEENVTALKEINEQYIISKEELSSLKVGQVITEIQYRNLSMKFGHVFTAGTGAEAVHEIITNLDLKEFIAKRKEELKKATGHKYKKIIKKLKLATGFLKSGISPEWMILTVLPVLPPDLRPMVFLDGGRFAASDLNDLYRRVISRNNRLRHLIEIGAPDVITRNEKRMLQESVDTLLHNAARPTKTVFSVGDKRKLSSLSDMLKGKQGRFRQNLLGKRTDYSGRSVIVVGPNLKLNECGLPKEMALKLFKPFIIGELIELGLAHNVKSAEKIIEGGQREVWDSLEKVTKDRYVLLNRAPTLHRLGIQAFKPILIEGKAIQVHPLVCSAFNADFDGDQMAVHLPLSNAAQKEAKNLIAATKNMLKPATGEPTTIPTQDMVLGCYYLTLEEKTTEKIKFVFVDNSEAINAYRLGHVTLHTPIKARLANKEIIVTTVGRLIFNSFIPAELGYKNEVMNKNNLKKIISQAVKKCGQKRTIQLCDDLKRIGFKFATASGFTIAASDVIIPNSKNKIITESDEIVKKINNCYWKGLLTDEERYNFTLKIWSKTKQNIVQEVQKAIPDENDINIMINSGARGNWGQLTQLAGMKGLVANPAGRTIELPVKSSLKEGFTILEYFIATHGGRKGKSDTALKTAEAGYLTRRLVDAVQDIIIREVDCKSTEFIKITRQEIEKTGEEFSRAIIGRTLAHRLVNPKTGELIADVGTEIDRELTQIIDKLKIDNLELRSILTCQTENGICQLCYGHDLGKNLTVEIGTAVGIIAAQSIGEPGTQLTMRTFHMGGVAGEADITQGLTRVEELFEARPPKGEALIAEISGKVNIKKRERKNVITLTASGNSGDSYLLAGFKPVVKKGDKVTAKYIIARALNSRIAIKAKNPGIVEKITSQKIFIRHLVGLQKEYELSPRLTIKVKNGSEIPVGTALTLGHFNLRKFFELTNLATVERYIVREVQTIYSAQGQKISDKHIEVIARQMFSKLRILDPGDTKLLPGEIVDISKLRKINRVMTETNKIPAVAEQLLLGLTRVSLHTESWLSAASFQETIRVLVEAASTKKIDYLTGLKENVIIGKLIPVGETFQRINAEDFANSSQASLV